MDERLEAEYKRILTETILKHGSLVGGRAGVEEYGLSFREPRHSAECGIAKTGYVNEDAHWDEFMGSLYEGDTTVHGMEVNGVTCNCGRIKDRMFRWSTSIGEAIRVVMEQLLTERTKSDGEEPGEEEGA